MQQTPAIFVNKDQPHANKTCRDCGYFAFGRLLNDGRNCNHPVNLSGTVDIITGSPGYYLTNFQMRSDNDLCGETGKLWIKYSTLHAQTYPEKSEVAPRPRGKTIGIDDI